MISLSLPIWDISGATRETWFFRVWERSLGMSVGVKSHSFKRFPYPSFQQQRWSFSASMTNSKADVFKIGKNSLIKGAPMVRFCRIPLLYMTHMCPTLQHFSHLYFPWKWLKITGPNYPSMSCSKNGHIMQTIPWMTLPLTSIYPSMILLIIKHQLSTMSLIHIWRQILKDI